MKLDQHIYTLLHEHDCVIVANFGGFVGSSQPSNYNPAKHILYPPSKQIAFNSGLKNNDGLLANHISKNENILYTEACEMIKKYVASCYINLEAGNKLTLEKVGVLFYDAEKNIQFVADPNISYLKDSFGLTSIHTSFIKREEELLSPGETIHRSQKRKSISSWKVMELIPAAAIVALMFTFPVIQENYRDQLSALNPFASKKAVVERPFFAFPHAKKTTAKTFELPKTTLEIKSEKVVLNEIIPYAQLNGKAVDIAGSVAMASSINNTESLKKESAVPSASANYFIIVGCFGVDQNALNFKSDLSSKGFNSSIPGKNSQGLIMVSASSYADITAAENDLIRIQKEINPQAWIYKKS